jgi:hypothetical protein
MSVMPYRVPAPPEPERGPDIEEIRYVRKLSRLRANLVLRLVAMALFVAAACVAVGVRRASSRPLLGHLGVARLTAANASTSAARARTEEGQRRFVASIRAATRRPVVHGARCDVPLPREASLSRSRSTLPLVVVREEDVAAGTLASPYMASLFGDLRRVEASLARGKIVALPQRSPAYDFVLVARRWIEPRATSSTSFEPGTIEGRVYVYDIGADRVVCSAEVRAASSNEVPFSYANALDTPAWLGRNASLETSLVEDLRFEIERAVVHSFGRHESL